MSKGRLWYCDEKLSVSAASVLDKLCVLQFYIKNKYSVKH
jgi:hypothetical protein